MQNTWNIINGNTCSSKNTFIAGAQTSNSHLLIKTQSGLLWARVRAREGFLCTTFRTKFYSVSIRVLRIVAPGTLYMASYVQFSMNI